MTDNHDVIIKVGLTADQYIAFRNGARELGLKDSTCGRMLILKFIRELAMNELSGKADDEKSTETVLRGCTYD